MARYIDADKLKPKTEWWREMDDYDHEREYCRSYYPLSEIENAPTEDVAPIVRGKWIFREITETIEKGVMECKCSVCGFGENTFNGGLIPFFLRDCNYCPNCGAKMEKSGEAE